MLHLATLATVFTVILSYTESVNADHKITIHNKCNVPVTARVQGHGEGTVMPGGEPFTRTVPTLSDGLRFWAATSACEADSVNGKGCTLGECAFFPPGTKPKDNPQGDDMRSQCNISGASGMNGKVSLSFGNAGSRTCNGFDDPLCFPTGEVCKSNNCMMDDQDLNAAVEMTIYDCFDQVQNADGSVGPRSLASSGRKPRRSVMKRF